MKNSLIALSALLSLSAFAESTETCVTDAATLTWTQRDPLASSQFDVDYLDSGRTVHDRGTNLDFRRAEAASHEGEVLLGFLQMTDIVVGALTKDEAAKVQQVEGVQAQLVDAKAGLTYFRLLDSNGGKLFAFLTAESGYVSRCK